MHVVHLCTVIYLWLYVSTYNYLLSKLTLLKYNQANIMQRYIYVAT